MRTHVSHGFAGGPEVTGLYDPATSSVQYVAAEPATCRCALIDLVLDSDGTTGLTSTASRRPARADARALRRPGGGPRRRGRGDAEGPRGHCDRCVAIGESDRILLRFMKP